jgi:glycosyltransferase involved in cell wall biosynthesis
VKKKILFMAINMNVGGTEKALLNMLLEIPKEKYDITLLLLEKYGALLNDVPSHVKIKWLSEYTQIKPILNEPLFYTVVRYIKKGNLAEAIIMTILYLVSKVSKTQLSLLRYLTRSIPLQKTTYDVAIAYAGPMDFISFFIVNKVKAKKKIQWIHFDITKIGFNTRFASKTYKNFNKIFVVSKEGKNKLLNELPLLLGKIETFSNIFSKDSILKIAAEGGGFEDEFKGTRILTVGRLSKEKGQDLAIKVQARLKREGNKIRWYCIGDGIAKEEYQELIKEYDLETEFILLGSKANPYPFMKQCDLYVQPSRHEGYCITLAEARCFANPIVATNFTGAKEQIINEHTGMIVDFDEEKMYQAIKRLLDDSIINNKIRQNLRHGVVDSTKEMIKFYSLVDAV